MHSTLVHLAESVTTMPLNLRKASAALYPPIPLYRRLLRAHRRLPIEMRLLGDGYVNAGMCFTCDAPSAYTLLLKEFRRHREVTNPVHIMGFLTQWKMYLDQLPRDPSDSRNFKKLDPTIFEKMSAEQLGQLYEFMHATKEIWKPASDEHAEPKTKS
ncbi:ACN9-domain-containing protein [Rhizopogon vinicolor AM-OR11-026]|uniref:Succinate dehydrogenase assembly factor 3 n=1 Tax=Rhizopogon vinicolor AM-OR11-026 TaxID=1314800 RepID=A0A1B7N9B5_9AGAM|nr:ACN9-domain-containing protein [Rhizopogon vinicolor AM-OR11-026]